MVIRSNGTTADFPLTFGTHFNCLVFHNDIRFVSTLVRSTLKIGSYFCEVRKLAVILTTLTCCLMDSDFKKIEMF